MWQQVSGQINTRFPGFLWCYNPGRGGALTLGRNWTLVFLLCYFFQSSCTYGYDSIEHKLITFRKKGSRVCATECSAHIWDSQGEASWPSGSGDVQNSYEGVNRNCWWPRAQELWKWTLNVWHVADLCVKYSLWIQSLCGQLIHLTDSEFELLFVLDILLKGPLPSSPTGVFHLISHIPLSHNLVLSALK